MQMSGFFMLHLYVDPEGESYEKLYGPGKGGVTGGGPSGAPEDSRNPRLLLRNSPKHGAPEEPQRSPEGQKMTPEDSRNPRLLLRNSRNHEQAGRIIVFCHDLAGRRGQIL